jgi:hypothetical protein
VSEFGKGFVICLVKFAEHFERDTDLITFDKWINETPERQKAMLLEKPPDNLNFGFPIMQKLRFFVESAQKIYEGDYKKCLSHRIELMMNAASDHLYEIEVPGEPFWDDIRIAVDLLKTKALAMGHGFTGQVWTMADLAEIKKTTREIAMMIDRKLHLEPEEGEW